MWKQLLVFFWLVNLISCNTQTETQTLLDPVIQAVTITHDAAINEVVNYEQVNIARRTNLINSQFRIFFINLISSNGEVVYSSTVRGNVGTVEHGTIFWFAEDGAYMEWNGTYFLSDQSLGTIQDTLLARQVINSQTSNRNR